MTKPRVTDEMIEAGLVAYLKAMKIKHAVDEFDPYVQSIWRMQVRAILEAALKTAEGKVG